MRVEPGARLVARDPQPSDREPRARAARQGGQHLREDAPATRLRHGRAGLQGPLPLRLPRHRRSPPRERGRACLVDHIQRFLLELGTGFAFVGRRVHLEVGDQDFYLDRLFYHLKLRCFVVLELKTVPFDPAFVGQLNLYLSATDDLLRHPDDKPTIGLLLCRSRNKLVVEYALRDVDKPIGVARWATRLVETLPAELEGSLPTVAQLEAELEPRDKE